MALIKCKECGQQISKKAKTCPHCGAPIKKKIGCLTSLLIILIVFILFVAIFGREKRPKQTISTAQPTIVPTVQPTATSPRLEPTSMPTSPLPAVTPTISPVSNPMLAPITAVASYLIPSKRKQVQDIFHDVSAITNEVIGWSAVPCPIEVCDPPEGILVAFRVKTDIGDVIPIWHISDDLSFLKYVNGTAKGYTPDLPRHTIKSISAAIEIFKNMPKESAIVEIATTAPQQKSLTPTSTPQTEMVPDIRWGKTELQRKQIYHELAEAESRAIRESEQHYPYPDPLAPGYSEQLEQTQMEKRLELGDKLTQQYTTELQQKYGLTDDQLRELFIEAYEKRWGIDQ